MARTKGRNNPKSNSEKKDTPPTNQANQDQENLQQQETFLTETLIDGRENEEEPPQMSSSQQNQEEPKKQEGDLSEPVPFKKKESAINIEQKIILDKTEEKTDNQAIDLAEKWQALEKERTANEQLRKVFDTQKKDLEQREAALLIREKNAKAGFIKEYQEVILQVDTNISQYHETVEKLSREMGEHRLEALQSLHEELESFHKEREGFINNTFKLITERIKPDEVEFTKHFEALIEEREKIEAEKFQLEMDQKELELQKRIINDQREQAGILIQEAVAERCQEKNEEYQELERKYYRANELLNEKKKVIQGWEYLLADTGIKPENIASHIQALKYKVEEQNRELNTRPSIQELDQLQDLETQKAEWENERYRLNRQIVELERRLSQSMVKVVEHEDLSTEIKTLDMSRKNLLALNDQLRQDIEKRIGDKYATDSVFPRCKEMDNEYAYQVTTNPIDDLQQLSTNVKDLIAKEGFYYQERDLRSFIAGMGMSKFIILQGISGTGKTSLPIKFANSVGGECEVIEVQAGWRDRSDLLGHYNTFERKFHESKFLQGLYKAGTPSFSDRLFFLLLDEMNLSFVEQYFADFISVLERQDNLIDLIPHGISENSAPKNLIDGRRLQIPPNVWFVGTANRDETTRDIADKTYDRAHVLELPLHHPENQQNNKKPPAQIVSYKEFMGLIKNAGDRKKEIHTAKKFFKDLQSPFSTDLGIGWGNRFDSHLEKYLPALMACGGTWAEAVDDLLSFKILRKTRDRYDLDLEDFDRLLESIEDKWKLIDKGIIGGQTVDELTRTIKLINGEQKNKKKGKVR